MRTRDVVVVGGGVIGSSVAYHLAREGLSVALLERDGLAGQASGAAAGMLAPIGEALHDGEASTALAHWGRRSLALFPELCARVRELSGIDPELEPSGLLRVAADSAEAERLCGLADRWPDAGLVWLEPEEACRHEPLLTAEQAGALWSPQEAHVRSPLLSQALARAAEQLGAEIRPDSEVRDLRLERDAVVGVRTDEGDWSAGRVVVCTGAFSGALQEWTRGAWSPPVTPVRGQICSLEPLPPSLGSIVWGDGAYLVPKRDGSLVVGATEERVGFDRRVTAEGLASLLEAAPRWVPSLREAGFREGWAGLRPGSPDALPGIGPVPGIEGLLVAVGHHRNGVLLSPVTGRLVCDCVAGKALPREAAVFDPSRW